MPSPTTAIDQLNLSFNQQEDRLLLKVGMADQSEITLWITRRVCKEMWHLLQSSHEQMLQKQQLKPVSPKLASKQTMTTLDDVLATPLPAPKLAARPAQKVSHTSGQAQQASAEAMDFSQTYLANRKPLSAVPFLVSECMVEEKATAKTSLAFKTPAGEVITMGLTLELVVALTNMMQLATKEANWDLLMLQSHATRHLTPTSEVIH